MRQLLPSCSDADLDAVRLEARLAGRSTSPPSGKSNSPLRSSLQLTLARLSKLIVLRLGLELMGSGRSLDECAPAFGEEASEEVGEERREAAVFLASQIPWPTSVTTRMTQPAMV